MEGSSAGIEIRQLEEAADFDVIRLVNEYTSGWPYSSPIDVSVLDHWRSMGVRYQPENVLVAYRDGLARAFLHGERTAEFYDVHLLAVASGAVGEATALLEHIELGPARGMSTLLGPSHRALHWYNGHVLGHEALHPHWERAATDAFVRAGWYLGHAKLMLVADLSDAIHRTSRPEGYEVIETDAEAEFNAEVFRFAALYRGVEVAHCLGRHFEGLPTSRGEGSVGQLGSVGTNEGHRNRGLATHLVMRSLQRLRDRGASESLVVTEFENASALRAYEKAGFKRRLNLNMWGKDLPS